MPATYTHHIFTKDVYKVINENIKDKIDKDIFNLFGKSFDILYFSKPIIGRYAHNHNSNLYFQNIIKYIRKNNLFNNAQVLAYLYGSICHYVLDSTIHPYVFYKTGLHSYRNKLTKKYKGKHNYMEYMIDAIIYEERNNKKIYKAKLGKEMFPKIKFNKELGNIIDYTYFDTFNFQNVSKYIKKGYKNYKFVVKYIMQSKYGIKYYIYKFLDLFNIFKKRVLTNVCYYIKKLDYSVLNLEHKKWFYPVDKKISFHYSFYDLYDVSIEKARKIINDLDNVIDKDEKELKKVLKNIGNLSYSTGKNVDKYYPMKYFEY